MAGAAKFYITDFEEVVPQCNGCTHITRAIIGSADRICCRHCYPRIQFSFEGCKDYHLSYKSKNLRELISIIENILIKKINVKYVEEVDGYCEEEHQKS